VRRAVVFVHNHAVVVVSGTPLLLMVYV
jgi:hypothetical protein